MQSGRVSLEETRPPFFFNLILKQGVAATYPNTRVHFGTTMGLSAKVLLERYFYLEEVKAALSDIGEPLTGSKPQLIGRLIASWESHNRDLYGLFDFLYTDALRTICKDYGLEFHGDRTALLRRIRRAELITTARKRIEKIETPPPKTEPIAATTTPGIRRLRFEWPLWGSLGLTAAVYFLLPLLGLTETLQFGAAIICFIGLWASLRYLSERA